ncbi:copper chaperone [Nitrosospira briensis]|uniref:Copper chaperone n=1 Tax=Nitrosospira briensis TaxID=35799 RepID=A0A1I5CRW3_9PROT|nr:heavy metal-associated domain-containing protein [Nitrosospira briensis]SFN89391.1 copper chaperone [Nitrosospira briensis]
MQTEIMKVKGMTCMGCVNSVKNVLERIPGVSSSEVSLEQGQVTIQYDGGMTGMDQFREAIEDAGFEVVNQA